MTNRGEPGTATGAAAELDAHERRLRGSINDPDFPALSRYERQHAIVLLALISEFTKLRREFDATWVTVGHLRAEIAGLRADQAELRSRFDIEMGQW